MVKYTFNWSHMLKTSTYINIEYGCVVLICSQALKHFLTYWKKYWCKVKVELQHFNCLLSTFCWGLNPWPRAQGFSFRKWDWGAGRALGTRKIRETFWDRLGWEHGLRATKLNNAKTTCKLLCAFQNRKLRTFPLAKESHKRARSLSIPGYPTDCRVHSIEYEGTVDVYSPASS